MGDAFGELGAERDRGALHLRAANLAIQHLLGGSGYLSFPLMQRDRGPWMGRCLLFASLLFICETAAEDFLYVLARPPGERTEIHWIPASAPSSARVLAENLDQGGFLHRYHNELWWANDNRAVAGDLVGQIDVRHTSIDTQSMIDGVRQGDVFYWTTPRQLIGFNLVSGDRRILAESTSVRWVSDTSVPFLGAREVSGFRGLAVHEDRLYIGDGPSLDSVSLDGSDRQQIATRDHLSDSGISVGGGLFGGIPVTGPDSRGLTMHDGQLMWIKGGAFWQMDLETGEQSRLSGELPEPPNGIAMTDDTVYWISDQKVWRWELGGSMHQVLYELGDTKFAAITVVQADPRPTKIWTPARVGVLTQGRGVYQLLFSENLRSWSPDFVGSDVNGDAILSWLKPLSGSEGGAVEWQTNVDSREAYFAAWQYRLEAPFDADEDRLPDYWERRHFGDLSALPDGDSNNDGLTHTEEASLFIGPKNIDADGDGLSNTSERAHVPPLRPTVKDTDGDGLSDGDEVNVHQTDPHAIDTDGDGFDDGFEVEFGGDPNEISIKPLVDEVLAMHEPDLLLHFDFESSTDGMIENHGTLGGQARVIGHESYLTRDRGQESSSRALDFDPFPDNVVGLSYLETDIRLEDLGIAEAGGEFSVALWVRTGHAHDGTILSANLPGSSEPSLSLQVTSESQDDEIPLRHFFKGPNSHWSTTLARTVPIAKWTHLAWTENADRWNIYVNGELHSTRIVASRPQNGDSVLWFGAQQIPGGVSQAFLGAVDDIRVYQRVIPESVIKVLAK